MKSVDYRKYLEYLCFLLLFFGAAFIVMTVSCGSYGIGWATEKDGTGLHICLVGSFILGSLCYGIWCIVKRKKRTIHE